MTKREVVAEFLEWWAATGIRNDPTRKRCAWCDFVDELNKAGHVTDRQANTWSNPFP